jgi:capsid protein
VPGDNFGPTTKFFLQMLAVSHDVPYELVAGDYSGLNYNTTRTVRNDFAKAMRPLVARHCRQFGARINRLFFDALHLTGKVAMPGYATNQRHWMAGIWQPPGQEPLDLLRESRGQIDLVKSLLFSPQEIITGRGRDPEDVLNELQEFKRMAEERGLSLEEVSTAMQTNPAAVAGNPTAPSKQEDTEQ